MDWPLPQDYNEAIQNPRTSFADPELRQGEAARNALGLPMPRSGSLADVYEVRCPATQTRWAVKCFTRAVSDLRDRYTEISQHLGKAQLPFFVDFNYLQKGIAIQGEWYGIVKMEWIEGLLLNEFIRDAADNPGALDGLLQVWLRMARKLRETRLAHGDLQHGNVLLVPGTKTRSLAIKLIDYDGMFVPALAERKPEEVGHPNYQHPLRVPQQLYNLEIDRFPLLLVATVLRCLKVCGSRLWERYDNGDNLLFREADLQSLAESALLHELWQLSDPEAHALVGHLLIATQQPPEETPLLDELFIDGRVRPLSVEREQQSKSILVSARRIRPTPRPRPISSREQPGPFSLVSPYNLAALTPEPQLVLSPELIGGQLGTPHLRSGHGERKRRLILGAWTLGAVTAACLLIGWVLWATTASTPTKAKPISLIKAPKPPVSQIAREEISKEAKVREEVIQSPKPQLSSSPAADSGPANQIAPKKTPEKQSVDTGFVEVQPRLEEAHILKDFAWRSAANRRKMLKEGGGNAESEAAVASGLKWLAQHQARDGRWSIDTFPQHGKCRCTGTGNLNDDIAGTALGLLPFLGAGKTHRHSADNPYQETVDKGLKYLTSRQKANGYFGGGTYYTQGLATIAVCEAYGLTSDPALKRSAQQAVNNIVNAQNANGGWDYLPGTLRTDTSVGGWQLMALKSGKMAGLNVPGKAAKSASRWLDRVMAPDRTGYGYDGPGDTNTMTAEGLLCREQLGWGPQNPDLSKGVEKLQTLSGPVPDLNNIYHYYYATQVLYHFGGEAWGKWNPKMRDSLIAKQDKGTDLAHQKGSWSPKDDAYGAAGGRLMMTSLSLLTLEVYYRYPPLIHRDAGANKGERKK